MLKIRLKRTGRKGRAFYKIVLTENLSRRDGKNLAEIGFYDPIEKFLKINKEDLLKYLKNGAYPTASVRHLILKMIEEYEMNF
jgi:small subunit ribosomal protein S16